ncbi:sugar transferase (PEP-CTERM/EpsH1 system associated) [Rhodothalassium salexigens DSM 2132]|uniref:Sugar transferase (PEP-CTERM/EpsH1 system associated) n=1 Tax=Rhodothalassium salexigens DSM 2132 TaxID=1188247 RepID=A0A4R2PGJ7_RHOSA|nr:TIGR03087 family PEP-CTERM/XrtA system glycosyltransferase [Rhodothalassium salexigens]MBB4211575.1 sugar transferase (PEP-CTERM/EpsH1 system associated) [Rhodothalassium salexigens DSM 2132]MBK1638405.1 sugar transferase [Rhodothalassium salexigens DSM 2132]TCP34493.1 sugar transferase (PEP-CTERM/EpsH1 system associated) [Rhodothalassium salexigens DSM 2132]
MPSLLFLVHRLPYPPNKGDKISSYNILKYFARSHDVYLGTFVDDPDDRQHVDTVRAMCRDVCAVEIAPRLRKWAALRGLLDGRALSACYYADRRLAAWVRHTLANVRPDGVLMYSGAMGQFVDPAWSPATRTIFELEDVDSAKWESYAGTKPWPLSWLYAREGRVLSAFERRMAARFDVSVLISKAEADLFRRRAPEAAGRIMHRTQGVDADYFDPDLTFANPYGPDERVLLFVGAMDYWPNVEAVTWYAREVLPSVQRAVPDARFYIVGRNPDEAVRALAAVPGVVVTGGVDDVRPYMQHALASCLPLRIARGVQNKALEAMAMAMPLLVSPEALTGIARHPGFEPWIAPDAETFTAQSIALLRAPPGRQPGARTAVLARHAWDTNLKRLAAIMAGDADIEDAADAVY